MYASKDALNIILVNSSPKDCFRTAKKVVIFLFRILVDRLMLIAPAPFFGYAIALHPDGFYICLSQMTEQKIPPHINNYEHGKRITIFNPIRTRKFFLINGPGGDRFNTTHSNVNNSEITKDKKSVFAPREAQFSDKKSKLFVIIFATLIFN